jgi:hypothetical protein
MAKFEIPESVAEINVIKLDGNVTTERYTDLNQYFDALVRANVTKPRGCFFQHGETTIENGKYVTWITVVTRKDDALE